jgi:hypothetical protein
MQDLKGKESRLLPAARVVGRNQRSSDSDDGRTKKDEKPHFFVLCPSSFVLSLRADLLVLDSPRPAE